MLELKTIKDKDGMHVAIANDVYVILTDLDKLYMSPRFWRL
jgi:hypothetical protein